MEMKYPARKNHEYWLSLDTGRRPLTHCPASQLSPCADSPSGCCGAGDMERGDEFWPAADWVLRSMNTIQLNNRRGGNAPYSLAYCPTVCVHFWACAGAYNPTHVHVPILI